MSKKDTRIPKIAPIISAEEYAKRMSDTQASVIWEYPEDVAKEIMRKYHLFPRLLEALEEARNELDPGYEKAQDLANRIDVLIRSARGEK